MLVTTLTKRLAEDLSYYLAEQGVRCKWLHSELDAFERVELLRELREGQFDALVGVNLLREGLDLPEVSMVAILDADKEGFLRSETSLIQTIGRAARNVNAKVMLYADKVTDSMQRAIDETDRRRDAASRPTTASTASRPRRSKSDPRGHRSRGQAARRRPTRRSAATTKRSTSPRNTQRAGSRDARRRRGPRIRAGRGPARPHHAAARQRRQEAGRSWAGGRNERPRSPQGQGSASRGPRSH